MLKCKSGTVAKTENSFYYKEWKDFIFKAERWYYGLFTEAIQRNWPSSINAFTDL